MHNPRASSGSRWWLVLGCLFAIVAATLFGASMWQNSVKDSRLDDVEAHSARAATLRDVVSNADQARAQLLQYVQGGDTTLIPQIDGHAKAAAAGLTKAVSQQGGADLTAIAPAAAGLADGLGRVITLRQSGDVNAAAAALEQLRTPFQEVLTTLGTAIDRESAESVSLQVSADSAESTGSWLLTAAIAVGVAAGIAFVFTAARSLVGRKAAETPSPA